MSHRLTPEQEMEIIKHRAIGCSFRELTEFLRHGKTQIARTLKQKNLCEIIYNQNTDIYLHTREIKNLRNSLYIFKICFIILALLFMTLTFFII